LLLLDVVLPVQLLAQLELFTIILLGGSASIPCFVKVALEPGASALFAAATNRSCKAIDITRVAFRGALLHDLPIGVLVGVPSLGHCKRSALQILDVGFVFQGGAAAGLLGPRTSFSSAASFVHSAELQVLYLGLVRYSNQCALRLSALPRCGCQLVQLILIGLVRLLHLGHHLVLQELLDLSD
jgi:hypothetical protein